MRWLVFIFLLLSQGALAQTKDARPLATLLDEGGRVVAASGKFVWIETSAAPDTVETYMCVIEISDRFRQALHLRKAREIFANWPKSLCFNAGSFE
ncbi:MAG: hypothetical protein AAGF44_09730 [Pseudomonadota bacterium]